MSSSLAGVLTTLLGGRAFAERYGEPPSKIVALHGWARTRADWSATLQGYDALALDLPGFGTTPAPDEGWSTTEYAEWLRECLEDAARYGSETARCWSATRSAAGSRCGWPPRTPTWSAGSS